MRGRRRKEEGKREGLRRRKRGRARERRKRKGRIGVKKEKEEKGGLKSRGDREREEWWIEGRREGRIEVRSKKTE